MKSIQMNDQTPFIKKEMEKIQAKIAPLLKKNLIFTFISLPLIVFSLFNLYLLLFHSTNRSEITLPIILFALSAAIGMALMKETKYNNKEIQSRSFAYIEKRIKSSKDINDYSKEHYLNRLYKQPFQSMEIFFEFLKQEERNKKMDN